MMRIPGGTRVGLCEHVPDYPSSGEGMVLDVTTDQGHIIVLLCSRCWVTFAASGDEDLSSLVKRQIVTGKNGWDVKVEVEVPS